MTGRVITIHEESDVVWTTDHGRLRAWIVQADGTLREGDPATALILHSVTEETRP